MATNDVWVKRFIRRYGMIVQKMLLAEARLGESINMSKRLV